MHHWNSTLIRLDGILDSESKLHLQPRLTRVFHYARVSATALDPLAELLSGQSSTCDTTSTHSTRVIHYNWFPRETGHPSEDQADALHDELHFRIAGHAVTSRHQERSKIVDCVVTRKSNDEVVDSLEMHRGIPGLRFTN